MQPPEVTDVEKKLAVALRRYLNAEDEVGRRERARVLAETVAWLTGLLLKGEEGWSRYWWVDGLLEDSIEVTSRDSVDISGNLIWDGERNQWLEPFQGSVRINPSTDALSAFEFHLGNAATGLQTRAHGTHLRREVPVTDWLFTLRGGPEHRA